MNARTRMQTAGSSEVAGSRVGGLSSRSCEAIRPPLKLRRHAGGWRCGAGCSTRGVLQVGIRSRLRHSARAIQSAAAVQRAAIVSLPYGAILRHAVSATVRPTNPPSPPHCIFLSLLCSKERILISNAGSLGDSLRCRASRMVISPADVRIPRYLYPENIIETSARRVVTRIAPLLPLSLCICLCLSLFLSVCPSVSLSLSPPLSFSLAVSPSRSLISIQAIIVSIRLNEQNTDFGNAKSV